MIKAFTMIYVKICVLSTSYVLQVSGPLNPRTHDFPELELGFGFGFWKHCALFKWQKKNLNLAEVLSFVSNPVNQAVNQTFTGFSITYLTLSYHCHWSHQTKKVVAMVSYNGFILDIGQYYGWIWSMVSKMDHLPNLNAHVKLYRRYGGAHKKNSFRIHQMEFN